MSAEEKPIEATQAVSGSENLETDAELSSSAIVMAEVVDISEKRNFPHSANSGTDPRPHASPPIQSNLDNIAAKGGAVGAIVLGFWSLIGAFITNWSAINALLGLMLGFWGLTSSKPAKSTISPNGLLLRFWGLTSGGRRLAWVGILLCLLSLFLSMMQVSEMVNGYLNAVDENSF